MEKKKYMFQVKVLRPDKRQYKQQSLELEPIGNLSVQVEIDVNADNFFGYVEKRETEILGELGYGETQAAVVEPNLVLTPAGLAAIMHQFEQYLNDDEVISEDFKPVVEPEKKADDDDDWGETTSTSTTAKVTSDDAEDWGDDDKEAKENFDVDEEW